jgi:hypothetical protein
MFLFVGCPSAKLREPVAAPAPNDAVAGNGAGMQGARGDLYGLAELLPKTRDAKRGVGICDLLGPGLTCGQPRAEH